MNFVVFKGKRILAFVLSILLLTIIFLAENFTVKYTNAYSKKLPIYCVKTDEKKLAISFDCAWGVDYTDYLLQIMQEENVKCTFFMVEFWVDKYPEYVKKIDGFGHEIGTHSATHPYMSKLSKDTMIKELASSTMAIEKITGKKVELFRPPYGDYSNEVIDVSYSMGLYPIQWSVDSLDWKNLSKTEIYNRVVKNVKNGSIVLFHNQGLHTYEALKDIIITLKKDGYEFVKISELIYKEDFTMGADGSQIKNK